MTMICDSTVIKVTKCKPDGRGFDTAFHKTDTDRWFLGNKLSRNLKMTSYIITYFVHDEYGVNRNT